jgi:hypothetical protein
MEIPESIKVGCINYDVKFRDLEEVFGIHDPAEQELIISSGLTEEMTRNTFIHEVVHAIFCQIGAAEEQKNEVLVQALTNEIDKLFILKPQ